jgi:hypothetical protein
MADIEIVQPVEGAARVTFDYTAASDALDAFSAMGGKLREQAGARVAPKDEVVVNWVGHYRDEFDRAWDLLDLRFQAGADGARWAPLPIYEAINEANDEQRRLNQIVEDAAAESDPEPSPQPASG